MDACKIWRDLLKILTLECPPRDQVGEPAMEVPTAGIQEDNFLTISIACWNFISGVQASFALLRGHSVMLSEGVLAAVLSFNKE